MVDTALPNLVMHLRLTEDAIKATSTTLVDPLVRMLPKGRQSRNQSDSTHYGQLTASAYSVQDTDGSTHSGRAKRALS
jgi:hypothetical protein